MTLSRRQWLEISGALAAGAALPGLAHAEATPAPPPPAPIARLQPMLQGVARVSVEEHRARIARAQSLMAGEGLDAVVLASGTGLEYFTGAEWGLSERFFGAVVPRSGDVGWVTPAFEKARALEQIQVGSDVRAWEEHESPFALVASILRDRGATGRVGIEETMPYTFANEIGAAVPSARVLSATPVTAGCRVIKDAHELALMRRAGEITVQAHRAVFQSLREGMTQAEVAGLSAQAHERLGMKGGALVLFGPDAAFPHGTTRPRPLRGGDVVLIDGGGRLFGYASDITRTGVFGAPPTDRQRRVWDIVRRAQQAGFGPDYKFFTHRLGHGIGMDGHEWTYLVRGNRTLLRPGMCFSDEPGIYIPGEMGIRHEDVITITADGAESFTKWTGSPEEPAVV